MKQISRYVLKGVFLAATLMSVSAHGLDRVPWNTTTKVGPDADVPGWYINLGVTGARAMLTPEEPKALKVMFVFKKAPADGKLEPGDRIVGANGRAFDTPHKFGYGMGKFGYEGPMMDLGNALEDSQGKSGGKLTLDVIRGQRKESVELQLGTRYGSYSATYPFQCRKSDLVFKEICEYLLKEQKPDGAWSDRDFALINARCIGKHPLTFPDTHGCPLLGVAWTALGAAVDPPSLRQLMDYNRWSFSLAQCPDGTFYYQPNRDNNPQDYAAAPRLSATAAAGLVLALKERRLQTTGAKPLALQAPASPRP